MRPARRIDFSGPAARRPGLGQPCFPARRPCPAAPGSAMREALNDAEGSFDDSPSSALRARRLRFGHLAGRLERDEPEQRRQIGRLLARRRSADRRVYRILSAVGARQRREPEDPCLVRAVQHPDDRDRQGVLREGPGLVDTQYAHRRRFIDGRGRVGRTFSSAQRSCFDRGGQRERRGSADWDGRKNSRQGAKALPPAVACVQQVSGVGHEQDDDATVEDGEIMDHPEHHLLLGARDDGRCGPARRSVQYFGPDARRR